MSKRQVESVSAETKNAIMRKSAFNLPNRPSEQGMKPDDIKRAFFQPIIDASYSAISEIERVIAELNTILSDYGISIDSHSTNKDNPHYVTKAQVGLGNADNTSDKNKGISDIQQVELDKKVNYADIVNNLTSIAVNKPLAAAMGKVLKENLDATVIKADNSIKSIVLNSENGILTVVRTNNSSFTIDLPLEFIIKSGYYNSSTKKILLVLDNGSTIEIPVADLVNEYYGDNSSITLYTDANDSNKLKFKISDSVKSNIDSNSANRHSHANKATLDTYNQSNSDIADSVIKKHIHTNKSILDGMTATFTTEKDNLINTHTSDITALMDMVSSGGTVIYENGAALASLNVEDIKYALCAAVSFESEVAEKANGYTKGGEIDKKIKELESRISN